MFFDIHHGTTLTKSIKLALEGPNGINPPNAFHVNTLGELFLIDYIAMYQMNDNGEIVKKQLINSASEKEFYKKAFLFPSNDNGFFYNENNDTFYIKTTNMQVGKNDLKRYYDTFSVVTEYDFNTNSLKDLEIPVPDAFKEIDFGFNNMQFFAYNNNDIVLNYSPLPELYIFDIQSKELNTIRIPIDGLPLYESNYDAITQNSNKGFNLNSFLFNSNFGPLTIGKNYLFRLYQSTTPESKRHIAQQNFKKNVVQIFDKEYTLLQNVELSSKLALAGNFFNENSVYLQMSAEHENELRFLTITIDESSE